MDKVDTVYKGGPAFPTADYKTGMTLRDWFAGQALAGLKANPERAGKSEDFAFDAYKQADAMLKERGQ